LEKRKAKILTWKRLESLEMDEEAEGKPEKQGIN
jgi:hypothetical protein